MLNKIIKDLEAKGVDIHNKAFLSEDYNESVKCTIQLETLRLAISIIKKHESEFEDKRIKNAIAYINGGLDGAEFNTVDDVYTKSQVIEILNDIKRLLQPKL